MRWTKRKLFSFLAFDALCDLNMQNDTSGIYSCILNQFCSDSSQCRLARSHPINCSSVVDLFLWSPFWSLSQKQKCWIMEEYISMPILIMFPRVLFPQTTEQKRASSVSVAWTGLSWKRHMPTHIIRLTPKASFATWDFLSEKVDSGWGWLSLLIIECKDQVLNSAEKKWLNQCNSFWVYL